MYCLKWESCNDAVVLCISVIKRLQLQHVACWQNLHCGVIFVPASGQAYSYVDTCSLRDLNSAVGLYRM